MKRLKLSSKGTLSYWFRDLELSATAKNRLKSNTILAYRRGLFAFNVRRTKSIRTENKIIVHQASNEVLALSKKELLIIGAALYWAEGTKNISSKNYPTARFSNSDPTMVRVFMRYLREILRISDNRIKPGIIVHPNTDPEKARSFWARVTHLSADSFWISVAVSRASKKRRPVHSLPYGTIQLRVNSRQVFFRIRGHISGMIKQLQ